MSPGFRVFGCLVYTARADAAKRRTVPLKRVRVRRQIILLILITTALRLAFGAAMGLGVDESYMVSAGRVRSPSAISTIHPLPGGSPGLRPTCSASEAPIVARLPFILLFALTTWLMARLG
jgi:hypothetical protein